MSEETPTSPPAAPGAPATSPAPSAGTDRATATLVEASAGSAVLPTATGPSPARPRRPAFVALAALGAVVVLLLAGYLGVEAFRAGRSGAGNVAGGPAQGQPGQGQLPQGQQGQPPLGRQGPFGPGPVGDHDAFVERLRPVAAGQIVSVGTDRLVLGGRQGERVTVALTSSTSYRSIGDPRTGAGSAAISRRDLPTGGFVLVQGAVADRSITATEVLLMPSGPWGGPAATP